MNMKKFWAIMLTVLLLLPSTMLFSEADSGDLTLKLGTATVDIGSPDTITLPLTLEKNQNGFIDFQFTIKFDPTILKGVSAVIPDDSLLVYAPDITEPETTEKPSFMSNSFQDKGEMMVAMAGVHHTDADGNLSQYTFNSTGLLLNLRFTLKDGLTSLSKALSEVEILVSQTSYTPFMFHMPDGSEIPHADVLAQSGGVMVTGCSAPKSIEILASGELNQRIGFLSKVTFNANVTADKCYIEEDVKWFVNDAQQSGAGLIFAYSPSAAGTYTVTAKSGSVTSNPIIVTVKDLQIVTPSPTATPTPTTTATPNPDFDYYTMNNQMIIAKYKGTAKDVVIPECIEGIDVCKIAKEAFSKRADITSVKFPSKLDEIMSRAFEGCTGLTSLTFPETLFSIQEYAFLGCSNIERVDMLNSLTWIGQYAFSGCAKLNGLYCYTETPFMVEQGAFEGCASDFTIYYLSDYSSLWSPKGEQEWEGYRIAPFELQKLIPNDDSGYTASNGFLMGVSVNTTVSVIQSSFSGGSIAVFDKNGKAMDMTAIVGTGFKVSLISGSNVVDELLIVVKGDLTGDGLINSRDIAALQKHVIETTLLSGAYLVAADINADELINSRDIGAVQRIIIKG